MKPLAQYGPDFFPDNSAVIALPNWKSPRLFLSSAQRPGERWLHSGFYPAHKRLARIYRCFLRFKAAGGIGSQSVPSAAVAFSEYLESTPFKTCVPAILVGTAGPTQKLILRLYDKNNMVRAYLKFGCSDHSISRLQREYEILQQIPAGLGPAPIKFGKLMDGAALLLSPIEGKNPGIFGLPTNGVIEYLQTLQSDQHFDFSAHPRFSGLSVEMGEAALVWGKSLGQRQWPVTIEHGDFAPWNMLISKNSTLQCVDWEYGVLQGFPYLDLLYYLQQVAGLIYKWPPEKARKYCQDYLRKYNTSGLSNAEIASLVEISAFAAYLRRKEDGFSDSDPQQSWRLLLWNRDGCR